MVLCCNIFLKCERTCRLLFFSGACYLCCCSQLHRRPQLERCGCYQFVGPLLLLLLQHQQLQQIVASLEPSASQQFDILAAAAATAMPRTAALYVPLVRARVFRRVDGFDFAQYKLALRLLRAIEPQTEPAAAAAAAVTDEQTQQQQTQP